jgi:hypothetical protein
MVFFSKTILVRMACHVPPSKVSSIDFDREFHVEFYRIGQFHC